MTVTAEQLGDVAERHTDDTSGTITWFRDGLRHREDGPALDFAHGFQQWWLHGHEVTGADLDLWETVPDGDRDLVADLWASGIDMADALAAAARLRGTS